MIFYWMRKAKGERDKGIDEILVKGTIGVRGTRMSFPTVHSLRCLIPRAHTAILVKSSFGDLWKVNPDIDEVIPYEFPKGVGRILGEAGIARFIRQRGIDLAVIFPLPFSAALMILLRKIPHRIGYKGGIRDWPLAERVDRTTQVLSGHRMYHYLEMIEPLGCCKSASLPSVSLNGKLLRTSRWFPCKPLSVV